MVSEDKNLLTEGYGGVNRDRTGRFHSQQNRKDETAPQARFLRGGARYNYRPGLHVPVPSRRHRLDHAEQTVAFPADARGEIQHLPSHVIIVTVAYPGTNPDEAEPPGLIPTPVLPLARSAGVTPRTPEPTSSSLTDTSSPSSSANSSVGTSITIHEGRRSSLSESSRV